MADNINPLFAENPQKEDLKCEKCPHISKDGWTTHCHLMHKDISMGDVLFTTQRHKDCPYDKEQEA